MPPDLVSAVSARVREPRTCPSARGVLTPDSGHRTDIELLRAKPVDLAQELVRLGLLSRLALDLGDADLARRAARYAVPVVRLLAGLDDGRPAGPLPDVDDLLAQIRPAPADTDEGAAT